MNLAPVYQGHAIFRNQPPHTLFNKTFDDGIDTLFLNLNEIDPYYIKNIDHLQNDIGFKVNLLLDPRNNQVVKRRFYDYSVPWKQKIFRSTTVSELTRAQHGVLLRVLKAMQDHADISEKDYRKWRELDGRRLSEKQKMQKFIFQYAQTHQNTIYQPAERLVELYKKWYKCSIEAMLKKLPNETYNTHTGLPHTRMYKGCAQRSVEIIQVKMLERKGFVPIRQGLIENAECRKIHCGLETFASYYNNAISEQEESVLDELGRHIIPSVDGENVAQKRFVIPLKALLFLLTAGDYPDLPTEVFLQIRGDVGDNNKYIVFENPLPARNCGWHTNKQVVEQSFAAHMSTSDTIKWLKLNNDNVEQLLDVKEAVEIKAYDAENQLKFTPKMFEEFMEEYLTCCKKPDNNLKFNTASVKWHIKESDSDDVFEIFTLLELSSALGRNARTFLSNYSIKLEYKPSFGCELMTKYELMQEWLRLRLLRECNVAEYGKCLRLSVINFELQLEEHITIEKVEEQLSSVYNIDMTQLLSNLVEFLKLLLSMPIGKYLLRYNPKYVDKLMLCSPTNEITQNTIFLHSLLQTEPNDILFMAQQPFLPISDNLCSVVHTQHKILPCAFHPISSFRKKGIQIAENAKATKLIVNDREVILERAKQKTEAEERLRKKKHHNAKKKKRKMRERLQKEEEKKQRLHDEELQKDIETDKLLFGF